MAWSCGQAKLNVAEGVEGDIEGSIICFPHEITITGEWVRAERGAVRCRYCSHTLPFLLPYPPS